MAKKVEEKIKKSKKEIARERLRRFHREFNKATTTAIMAAFGFLVALVWKDVITEFVDNISEKSPIQGKLISALIVTIICVLGIMIVTKIFSEKKEDEKK